MAAVAGPCEYCQEAPASVRVPSGDFVCAACAARPDEVEWETVDEYDPPGWWS